MVENKLKIIINGLMWIKHELHVLKCLRCQAEENNVAGRISSSASGNNVYISKDEEMDDA
jgi:hypothetical protein